MKKALYLAALSMAAALIGSGIARAFPAPTLRMGQLAYDRDRSEYRADLAFGQDGRAVLLFNTPEQAQEFAQLRGVEIVMRAAPVRIARSETEVMP